MMNTPITLENLQHRASFRFAEPSDVPELMLLYERFYGEAVYKEMLEFDHERASNTVLAGITTNTRPHILAIVDGMMAGFLSYVLDHTFSVRPCLVMMELYVVPEYRRGALGRCLVGLAVLEGKNAGAGAFHAPVASGMTEARTLFNLFGKAGFIQFGYMLRRKL